MYGTSLPVPKVGLRFSTRASVYMQEKVHLYHRVYHADKAFLLCCKL